MEKATATRISRPGSTPEYLYKGIRIINFAGFGYGRVWAFNLNGKRRYSSTLEGAKFDIDFAEQVGA